MSSEQLNAPGRPPDPQVSTVSTVSPYRKSLAFLLIATVLIGLFYFADEGRYLSLLPLTVRGARAEDSIAEEYFGFEPRDLKARNILVVSGPFSQVTALSACLFLVRSGVIEQGNSFTVGRTPNRIPNPAWQWMEIKLALGEKDTPSGRLLFLGSGGHTRGSACWYANQASIPVIQAVSRKTLSARLSGWKESIAYVEGNNEFVIDQEMSLDDFAKRNCGNFLVVVVKLDE